MTTRLIERYLPIAELSEESTRERRSMTALPPIYYLHVWWARRPLIASRAAILASLLSEGADVDLFKYVLGIHGDPVAGANKLAIAKKTGVNVKDPYGYDRAFKYTPTTKDLDTLLGPNRRELTVLDVTAGGGAIPFEASRLGLKVIANDLNPVAALILRATVEYPNKLGPAAASSYAELANRFRATYETSLGDYIPQPNLPGEIATTFLWARTITCPHCSGIVPLSPTWSLAPSGTGVAIIPELGEGPHSSDRRCSFQIVSKKAQHAPATVADGDGLCPFSDCGRPIDGDEIKQQAQSGRMGDQMYAVVVKREQILGTTKAGKRKIKWVRSYRAPSDADQNDKHISERLGLKMPEWEALGLLPTEAIPSGNKTDEPLRYGHYDWVSLFSPRQLLAHGTAVETYQRLLSEDTSGRQLSELEKSSYIYLSLALDKLLNYNSRMSIWMTTREVVANTFNRHDFAFCWSYAEMALLIDGMGLDWALDVTGKALGELIALTRAAQEDPGLFAGTGDGSDIQITNLPAAQLTHLTDHSIDTIVMDPPYGANVMYAELSDFFYVWLKRTAGLIVPELFTRRLADKESEAVANKAHFQGQKGSAKLATRDYQEKMAGIFDECRRVLKTDGVMTVMFTHKDTGAWDALAMSLMKAGFVITASWPVNTEATSSLHIVGKAAANSTILLICRLRSVVEQGGYWEDVEPLVREAVRSKIEKFQAAGITGVDLYLASFGPALEAFSRHWPLTRGMPAPKPPAKRGSQGDLLEEFDPYAVRPEDALNAARREVKAWRLAQLADRRASRDMDPATAWVALAWDAFRAPQFAYDEGLRLARAVGLDMTQVVGRIAEKKGSDLKLWDSATRVAKGVLGPANGSRGMIDAIHHAAHTARNQSVEAARDLLEANGLLDDDEFKVALEVMLEVLPPSKTFSGIDADDAVKPAADDFDALEKLRRIVYGDEIGAPRQLSLYEQLDAV